MDWEFGISRHKQVCIEWINSKVLLISIGNYIQYPMINHNRKSYVYVGQFSVQHKLALL